VDFERLGPDRLWRGLELLCGHLVVLEVADFVKDRCRVVRVPLLTLLQKVLHDHLAVLVIDDLEIFGQADGRAVHAQELCARRMEGSHENLLGSPEAKELDDAFFHLVCSCRGEGR